MLTTAPRTSTPSDKQVAFFNRLMSELLGTEFTTGFTPGTTRRQASEAIDGLLAESRKRRGDRAPRVVTPDTAPALADGRYAIRSKDGKTVRFFKLDTGKDGSRWAGRRFLSEQHGENFEPIRDRNFRESVIAYIAKDAVKAQLLYGTELGICGVCGRTLTDDASRHMGIGPDCFEKLFGRRRTAADVADATPPAPVVRDEEQVVDDAEAQLANFETSYAGQVEHLARMTAVRNEAQAQAGIRALSGDTRLTAQLARVNRAVEAGDPLTLITDGILNDENLDGATARMACDYAKAVIAIKRGVVAPGSRAAFGF